MKGSLQCNMPNQWLYSLRLFSVIRPTCSVTHVNYFCSYVRITCSFSGVKLFFLATARLFLKSQLHKNRLNETLNLVKNYSLDGHSFPSLSLCGSSTAFCSSLLFWLSGVVFTIIHSGEVRSNCSSAHLVLELLPIHSCLFSKCSGDSSFAKLCCLFSAMSRCPMFYGLLISLLHRRGLLGFVHCSSDGGVGCSFPMSMCPWWTPWLCPTVSVCHL